MFSIFPSINQDNVFKLTSTKRKKKLFKFVRIHIDELLLRKTVLTQFQKANLQGKSLSSHTSQINVN